MSPRGQTRGGQKGRALGPLELELQLGAPSTLGGCWELFSGLLKEQYALLTNKLSFQTCPAYLQRHDGYNSIRSVCLSSMRICVYFDAIHPTTPPSNSPYPHSQFVCSGNSWMCGLTLAHGQLYSQRKLTFLPCQSVVVHSSFARVRLCGELTR